MALTGPTQPLTGTAITLSEIEAKIRQIAQFVIVVSVILAVIFIIWGGITYMFAGGDSEAATKAKTRIWNGVIGAINAAGSGIFGFINKIIKAVNTVLALIGRLPGGRQWKPLAEVKWSPIDAFSLQGFGAGTRFDTEMGSFGGGGGGAHFGGTLEGQGANIGGPTAASGGFGGGGGGEGGSGLGLGGVRATSTASAADAINSSASQTTNAIQHLEAVNAEQMAELLRLMAAMPQAVRDAIVVYSGATT